MAITPKVVTQSEPITEIVKVTQPVGTVDVPSPGDWLPPEAGYFW